MVMVGQLSMAGRDMKLSLKVILADDCQGRYLLTFENRESCHGQGDNINEVASIFSAWFPLQEEHSVEGRGSGRSHPALLCRICMSLHRVAWSRQLCNLPWNPKLAPVGVRRLRVLVVAKDSLSGQKSCVVGGCMRRQLMNGCSAGWLSRQQRDTPGWTSRARCPPEHLPPCPQLTSYSVSCSRTILNQWSCAVSLPVVSCASVSVNFPVSAEVWLACCSPIES